LRGEDKGEGDGDCPTNGTVNSRPLFLLGGSFW